MDTHLVSTASYDQYLALLCSAATQYDKARQTTPLSTLKNAVSMYHAELGSDVGLYYDDATAGLVSDEPDFDLDQWSIPIYSFSTIFLT